MTILCVLKTGKFSVGHLKDVAYKPEHVQLLQRQCEKFAPGIPFYVLSDVDVPGVNVIPLKHDWFGWWSKMELFRPDLEFDQIFYMDLDTVLVGDITEMVTCEHQFTALRCQSPKQRHMNSGVMAWRPKAINGMYNTFVKNASRVMREYVAFPRWGDQSFIAEQVHGKYTAIQDLFPGRVHHYKYQLNHGKVPLPKESTLITFSGKPKPWEVTQPWIPKI